MTDIIQDLKEAEYKMRWAIANMEEQRRDRTRTYIELTEIQDAQASLNNAILSYNRWVAEVEGETQEDLNDNETLKFFNYDRVYSNYLKGKKEDAENYLASLPKWKQAIIRKGLSEIEANY